jgi:hypothetical protein
MKSIVQATSSATQTKHATASGFCPNAARRSFPVLPKIVADPGKIRLGGAWRLPSDRKSG